MNHASQVIAARQAAARKAAKRRRDQNPELRAVRAAVATLTNRGYRPTMATNGTDHVDVSEWTEDDAVEFPTETGMAMIRYVHADGRRVSLTFILGNSPSEVVADGSWSEDPDAYPDLEAVFESTAHHA